MNITEARIDHLSNLARLSLPGGEKEEIARELERILDYMAVLDGLDTGKTGQAAGQGLYDWSQKDADDFRRRKQSPYFAGVKEWAMPDVK